MNNWKTVYHGDIDLRRVRIELGAGTTVRLHTAAPGTNIDMTVEADSPGELEERLVESGLFTELQADQIIRLVSHH